MKKSCHQCDGEWVREMIWHVERVDGSTTQALHGETQTHHINTPQECSTLRHTVAYRNYLLISPEGSRDEGSREEGFFKNGCSKKSTASRDRGQCDTHRT